MSRLQRSVFFALCFSAIARGQLNSDILTDADVANYPELHFGDQVLVNRGPTPGRSCKVLPGDSAWPSTAAWNVLNLMVGGRLVKPDPIASVCYAGADYNATACTTVTNSWPDSVLHENHPSSIMSPLKQGMTCLYTATPNVGNCTLGGYPVYVVNAQSPADVQAAVNFARNANIRLVIKNTGHDFNGKSSGAGSLSIRTHNITGIQFIPSLSKDGYNGPAFRVASGTLGGQLYAAAAAQRLFVVGGAGPTVGWAGGYLAAGGHSPLSTIHGMAADHILSMDVVTADGRLVTAEKNSNPDLFWALRGGGGSAFGVVISVLVQAYPDLPFTLSSFQFLPSAADEAKYPADTSNNDFWAVIRLYLSLFVEHANAGIYSYFTIFPTANPGEQVFSMIGYLGANKTVAQVTALLQPVFDIASQRNVSIVPNTRQYPGFFPAWQAGFPKEAVGQWYVQPAGRLWPRDNWSTDAKFNSTFQVIRNVVSHRALFAFNIAPTLAAGGNPDNSVNPAWRNTVMHSAAVAIWDPSIRDLAITKQLQANLTSEIQSWRDVSPGAGSYMNEGDINEPNFQQSFYGSNYARLYSIKQTVDPTGVFFAETAVGSENWSTGQYRLGRLCPV